MCPDMTSPHFDFLQAAAECCGYKISLLRSENENIVDIGTKHVNNDACYPVIIVTGKIMDAVLSGGYDTDNPAVRMCQTGGRVQSIQLYRIYQKGTEKCRYGTYPGNIGKS